MPKGCGFLGSWGTVGRPLLLVALIGLLPLAKGLYRGIVRSIDVVIMAVAAAEASRCCHWRFWSLFEFLRRFAIQDST